MVTVEVADSALARKDGISDVQGRTSILTIAKTDIVTTDKPKHGKIWNRVTIKDTLPRRLRNSPEIARNPLYDLPGPIQDPDRSFTFLMDLERARMRRFYSMDKSTFHHALKRVLKKRQEWYEATCKGKTIKHKFNEIMTKTRSAS